jgi:hypothetical protein
MGHTLLLGLSSLGVKRLLILGPYLTLIVILAGTDPYCRHIIFTGVEVVGFDVLNSITEETRCLIRRVNITFGNR